MRILVLTHRLPFAPNRGDRIRAFHIIKTLASHHDVSLVSLVHDRTEAAQTGALRALGVRVATARVPKIRNLMRAAIALGTSTPLTHLLLDSPYMRAALEESIAESQPDLVLVYCSGVAPLALAAPLAGVPMVLDMVDVDSAKWEAFGRTASFPRSWVFRREARCLSAFEDLAANSAIATIVVNERERDALLKISPDTRVLVVPNGVDVDALSPPDRPVADERVIFPAVFNYQPNVDGALWFAEAVWPMIRAARPRARLTLAGASPTRAVRRLADNDRSIEVTGSVPDIRPFLWRSAIAVAPMLHARGVQNKVLEAAAAGLPSIVTQAVWDGLPGEVLAACRVAKDAASFAKSAIELLSLPAPRRRLEAQRADLSAFAWPKRLALLVDLVDATARREPAVA
jgi:sugar transferase (PEP-CTERM/EpsH1 system associated)